MYTQQICVHHFELPIHGICAAVAAVAAIAAIARMACIGTQYVTITRITINSTAFVVCVVCMQWLSGDDDVDTLCDFQNAISTCNFTNMNEKETDNDNSFLLNL